jgi:hypothetical protein
MDWKEVLVKRVDVKGLLVEDVLRGLIKGKLEEIVKDTSNPFDDSLLTFVYPLLEEAVAKAVDELVEKANA